MKYFIDLEFHEHERPVKFLGITIKKIWTIDLISIGIACEDGRTYYAINRDLNLKYAKKNLWLKWNVIDKLPPKQPLYPPHGSPNQWQQSRRWIPLNQIKEEIIEFCHSNPDFYGYYCDYDWVRFCWIFGNMIQLPGYFPKYCVDLKQMMDERGLDKEWLKFNWPEPINEHDALVDSVWNRGLYKKIIQSGKSC